MNEHDFREKLFKLINEIKQLPESKDMELTSDMSRKCEDLLHSFVALQDSLDSLRLNVKYLQFDLEATKKENAALRRKLEEFEN